MLSIKFERLEDIEQQNNFFLNRFAKKQLTEDVTIHRGIVIDTWLLVFLSHFYAKQF